MVLGISMAAFMFASAMVAMVPIGGAESRDDNFNHDIKDTVNIFAVGPKGSAGRAIDSGKNSTNYAENLFGETVPVFTLDRTFEKKIDVDKDADTGSYIIVVLSPGRDGIYNGLPGEITPNNFAVVFVTTYNQIVRFAKTQEQLLSMAVDATIGAAGSDDLAWF